MINSVRRLMQKDRKKLIKESTIYWLDDKRWRTGGLIHNFVMTCIHPETMEKIEPWVTRSEVDTVLEELEKEGIAISELAPLVEEYDLLVTYWKKHDDHRN